MLPQGYIQMVYLQLRSCETAFVQRNDATSSTMLRKVATKSQSNGVWVDSKACVANGEAVTVVRCVATSPPSTLFFVNSRTLIGCTDPLRREVGAPHQRFRVNKKRSGRGESSRTLHYRMLRARRNHPVGKKDYSERFV